MKCTFKSILVLIYAIGFAINLNAQNIYKGNPWIFSFGGNLIIEDGSQFKGYIENKPILWNLSPLTLGVEKRLKKGFAINSILGTNIYVEKQKIANETLKKSSDVVFVELNGKYNINSFLKDTTYFDPFIGAGFGYIFKNGQNTCSLNLCFGFNYWITNKFAINTTSSYKFGLKSFDGFKKDNLFQLNLMLIQIIE